MAGNAKWMGLMVLLSIIDFTTSTLSLFLSANPKTGGALADLTFNIIGTGGDITNSMTTLEFVFPLEYSLGAQGLTCIRISGFSQDPICSISATNTLRIDLTYLNTSPFSIIALIIQKIQNPIVESGPFNYNLRLLNSGNAVLFSSNFVFDDNFVPPTIVANDPVFLSQQVYTDSDLTFKITPPYNVYAGSKVVINLPNYRSSSPPITFFGNSVPATTGCSTLGGINAGRQN